MSDVRLVVDYDTEDIGSLAVTEAALLSQVFDIRNRKETLINIAVKESREEQTVKEEEEPDTAEPQPEPETAELDEELTDFHRRAWKLRDRLEALPRRTRINYQSVENAIDEMLLASTWEYEVEEEPQPEEMEKEDVSEIGAAISEFRQAAQRFRGTLDNLVTLSGVQPPDYDKISNIFDEILQKPVFDLMEEKK